MPLFSRKTSIAHSQHSQLVEGSLDREQHDIEIEMQTSKKPLTASGIVYTQSGDHLGWRHWTVPTVSLITASISGPVMLRLLYSFYITTGVNDRVTGPNISCDMDRLWSSRAALFQVNIRSGKISFTAAKIIDVVWDTVVGRGGQLLLMWMSYRVHTDVMMYLAEREAIDFKLFATTMLYNDSIRIISVAIKSLFSRMNRRTRWMLAWMVLAVSYVLFFPTLLSASTSYVTATRPTALLIDNTTVPVDTYLKSAAYSLTDHGISTEPNPWYISVENISSTPSQFGGCTVMRYSSHSWSVGGIDLVVDGKNNVISNSTIVQCGFYLNQHFYDKTSVSGISNATYLSLPNKQAICQPDGASYQWGASYELLMILVVLQCTWSIGMWVVWIISNRGSRLIRQKRKMGSLRAVLDVAKPLTEANVDDGMILGNAELKQIVRQRGRIKYHIDDDITGERPRVNILEYK